MSDTTTGNSLGYCPAGHVRVYGCVRCQKHHVEGTAVFRAHLFHQSKEGVQTWRKDEYLEAVKPG